MKKLVFSAGKPETIDSIVPHLLPETVLVKNHYSFVSSGTELSTLQKNKFSVFSKLINNFSENWIKIYEFLKTKGISSTYFLIKSHILKKLDVGYSTSGQIISSNSNLFRVGDFVACAGFGFANHAEYSIVPVNLLAKVNQDSLREASATSLGAIALQAIRRANVQLGEMVCVIGLGLIGQLIVQLANLSGLVIFGVDPQENRQQLALNNGAKYVFGANDDWSKRILFASNRFGVDAVILSLKTTDESIINKAISICRPKGKIILVGDVPITFSREDFYKKELDFLVSCSLGPGRYDHEYEQQGLSYPYHLVRWTEGRNLQFIANLISEKKLKIKSLISKELTLKEADLAYKSLENGDLGIIFKFLDEHPQTTQKNIVKPEKNINQEITIKKDDQPDQAFFSKPQNFKKNKLPVNCALIGAGGFAKTVLVPILKKIETIKLHSVFDPVFLAAQNFKDVFSFERIAESFEEILESKDIDVVILTSPDKFHCNQTIQALSLGKAVFCEKPMVTNWEEYETLKKFFKKNQNSNFFFAADFNRSWAPMILEVKKRLTFRTTPLYVNYRVAAGFVKKDNFLQNTFSRLIGEICHFLELFLFLVNSNPTKMTVTFSGSTAIAFEENLTITLLFADGSITNLFYSSLASTDLEKERVELFWDQQTVIIDDYKNLTTLGFSKNFNSQNLNSDKGHGLILSTFLNSVIKNDHSFFQDNCERFLKASALSLHVENLLPKNGGILNITEEQTEQIIQM